MQQGQAAAQTPFQQPAAPVAGFSQDQLSAFQNVNNAQGMAQPYINQAAQDFTPQGTQAFLNPYASNVMASLQNTFGEQQQQATGQLTQAAGGVGADRIAVGQADLANQQGLAAGQTMSNLYGQAAQQAQSAGYGTAALGSQAQNAALQGAQAQLGTGGLQQQLSQAQLNSPYQQQLAQLAYPFQTAQFNAGITGALAPGLGGTTSGQGATQTTPAPPSIWSQILGLGTAAGAGVGAYNQFGGSSTGGTGKGATSMNGQLSLPQQVPGYQSAARGGAVYARGGVPGYDDGGSTALPAGPFAQVPQGLDNAPIDIAPKSVVPAEQLTPIKANIPQLNLNPPQAAAQASPSGSDIASAVGSAAKIAALFAKRGGAIPGYADGGDTMEERFKPAIDAIANGDFDPAGANSTTFQGQPGMAASNTGVIPIPRARPSGASADNSDTDTPAYPPATATASTRDAYAQAPPADDNTPTHTPVPGPRDAGFAGSPWAALMQAGLAIAGGTSPYAGVNIGKGAQEGVKTLEAQRAAEQKDTTINQAAKRLQMEADAHVDAMTKLTKQQSVANERADAKDEEAKRQFDRPYNELTKAQQATIDRDEKKERLEAQKPVVMGTGPYGPIYGKRDPNTGELTPINPENNFPPPTAPATPPASGTSAPAPDSAPAPQPTSASLPPTVANARAEGLPETGTFKNEAPPSSVNPAALEGLKTADANTVKAIAEGRQAFLPLTRNNAYNHFIMDKVHEYDPDVDQTTYSRRGRTANFFAVGTQGGGGQNIAAMNTFGQHAGRLLELSAALDRGQFKNANEIKNWMAEHGFTLGQTKGVQDTLGAYEVAQKAVADEGAKVFAGTNSALADRSAWEGKFDPSNPASVTRAKLQEVVKLIDGRLNSLTAQYNDGMRTTHEPQEFIKPKTREIFDRIRANEKATAAPAPAATAPASPQTATPKQIIQNGHTYDLQPDGSYR